MTSVSTAQSRTSWGLMRDRTFGPYLTGKILSSCGNWVQQIAAAVLMFQLARSAFMVGAVSMALFAGPLLLALWTGVLSDRRDRRRVLMVGRGLTCLAAGVLAVLISVQGVDGFGGPPVLLAAAAVMGVGHALSLPAMQALVPGLVPDKDLEQALALASVAPSIARTVGPAGGAGLLLLGGPELAFAVASATHGLFVLAMVWVRARRQQHEAGRPRVLGGVRYLRRDRTVAMVIVGIALMGFGADPVITLTPSLADRLGGGSGLVGLFASVFGAGAVLMVLMFRRLRDRLSLRQVGIAGYVVAGAGLMMAALVPFAAGAAVGFFVTGAGFLVATVALSTRIQRRVPDELRGRVMALWGVAFLGSRPLAAPINGAVADATSVTVAMLAAAVVVLAASLLVRVEYTDSSGSS